MVWPRRTPREEGAGGRTPLFDDELIRNFPYTEKFTHNKGRNSRVSKAVATSGQTTSISHTAIYMASVDGAAHTEIPGISLTSSGILYTIPSQSALARTGNGCSPTFRPPGSPSRSPVPGGTALSKASWSTPPCLTLWGKGKSQGSAHLYRSSLPDHFSKEASESLRIRSFAADGLPGPPVQGMILCISRSPSPIRKWTLVTRPWSSLRKV